MIEDVASKRTVVVLAIDVGLGVELEIIVNCMKTDVGSMT